MADTRADATINGGGTVAAGSYEVVTLNGAGTIVGDIDCTVLRVNGSGNANGNVRAGEIIVNGTATFSANVQAATLTINGDTSVRGGAGIGRLVIRGNCSIEGGLNAREVDLKGVLRTKGDLVGEMLRGEGTLEAADVRVDEFDMAVYGPSKVRSLEGARVTLRQPGSFAEVFMFFAEKRFSAESIRANEVWLEHTSASLVSAGNVTLGQGARIGRVVYSGTLSKRGDAQVTEEMPAAAG